jgi:hypothetical protein
MHRAALGDAGDLPARPGCVWPAPRPQPGLRGVGPSDCAGRSPLELCLGHALGLKVLRDVHERVASELRVARRAGFKVLADRRLMHSASPPSPPRPLRPL